MHFEAHIPIKVTTEMHIKSLKEKQALVPHKPGRAGGLCVLRDVV